MEAFLLQSFCKGNWTTSLLQGEICTHRRSGDPSCGSSVTMAVAMLGERKKGKKKVKSQMSVTLDQHADVVVAK